MKKKYGVHVGSDNKLLFNECDIVILSVKPQSMESVLSELVSGGEYDIKNKKLLISIAAGVPMKKLEDSLYPPLDEASARKLSIIRVMPNTPCLVLCGMSVFCLNANADDEDVDSAKVILGSMGKVIELKEKDMDAVTAMSGSGSESVFLHRSE